ncbi:MAG: sensor histidine kinase [Lachnospiraceae bacterium]
MNKWYQSRACKGILIGLAHVAVAIAVISMVQLYQNHNVTLDVMMGTTSSKEYEDTESFAQEIQEVSSEVLEMVMNKQRLETDGVYNPDKVVNIMTKEVVEEAPQDGNELWYRMGDLIDMGKTDYYNSYADVYIVAEKEDGTYDYYKQETFENLLLSGELILAGTEELIENGALESDGDTYVNGEEDYFFNYMYCQIMDKNGDVKYTSVWDFECGLKEECLTLGDKNIIDIVNTDSDWNGRLDDIIGALENSLYEYNEYYTLYSGGYHNYEDGNTNFSFLFVDKEQKTVYSNREEYNNYEDYEQNIKKIEDSGKYVVAAPKLADFSSNINKASATQWQDQLQMFDLDDYVYAAAVDTEYPVQDRFYSSHNSYQDYKASLVIVSIIVFLAALVWLTAVAGRSRNQEGVVLNGFDKLKTELACCIVIGLWGILMIWLNEIIWYADTNSNVLALTGVIGFVSCSLFLTGYLSLVRRIKAGTVWKNSLLNWLWRNSRRMWHFLVSVFTSWSSTWKLLLLGVVFIITHWIALASYGFIVMVAVTFEIVAFIYLLMEAMARQKIRSGLKRIVEGEIDYQIPLQGLRGDYYEIAERINRIGEGLDAAVEKSIRDERLKTDLITNVSHDIKTPLTSIINYVDLLKRENFDDPKIKGYLDILEAKAQRLKALTEDVVEASKVSSGNIKLEFMNIDLVEMLYQANGEFAERFEQKKLQMILKLPEETVLIRVDGRRMWRVLENIFNNTAKYAMEGTRIYGDMSLDNGEVVFSLKNVSANELNISPDELTERFIRGDDSRTTEGSGLGLSIAKSLTEMQGGKFKIIIDGDLFKVIIRFPKVE